MKGDDFVCMFVWMCLNDLVWNYVVNNYLMGEDLLLYNVLFWNDDFINLLVVLYLDYFDFGIYKLFMNLGIVEIVGYIVDLIKVDVDSFIVVGVIDYIMLWKVCFCIIKLMGLKNIEFVFFNFGYI